MTDDVVAELDEWLTPGIGLSPNIAEAIKRARDEIEELRAFREEVSSGIIQEIVKRVTITTARAQALEEAARLCELPYATGSTGSTLAAVAAAIRALADKP